MSSQASRIFAPGIYYDPGTFLPGVLPFLEAHGFLESSRSRLWRTLFLDVVKVPIVKVVVSIEVERRF
jgi:hypothetical protein